MFSIGDDFWIENGAGQRVFKVDGKALRIRKTLELQDGAGRELYKIQEKLATVRDVMTIEGPAGKVATVRKALFAPLHEGTTSTRGGWQVVDARQHRGSQVRDQGRRHEDRQIGKEWFAVATPTGFR